MNEKRIVKPWQAGLMLLVGIAVIIAGLLVMKLNNRIVLALDGVIMCLMAWCFGIPYAELQQGIKDTVSSMIVAILILLSVGVLVGGMVKDLYPEYHLDRKNLMRTLLDTGTGLAPMVSWSTTGSYTATTLGVGNLAFLPYAPMLWLSIVFSIIFAVTGIATAKAKED